MARLLVVILVLLVATVILGTVCLVAAPFDRQGRVFGGCFRAWSWAWLKASGVRLTIERQDIIERLGDSPYMLAGNHQSALDIPLLAYACHGRIRFAAKDVLFNIPIVGWLMSLHGFTPIDRGNARRSQPAMERMIERLRAGHFAQVLFPEGTRTYTGAVGPFRLGAFKLIERAAVPVVPFVIDGAYKVQHRSSLRVQAGPVTLRFGEPVAATPEHPLTRDEIAQRVRAVCLCYLPEAPPQSDNAHGLGAVV